MLPSLRYFYVALRLFGVGSRVSQCKSLSDHVFYIVWLHSCQHIKEILSARSDRIIQEGVRIVLHKLLVVLYQRQYSLYREFVKARHVGWFELTHTYQFFFITQNLLNVVFVDELGWWQIQLYYNNQNDKQRSKLTTLRKIVDKIGPRLEASNKLLASNVLIIRSLLSPNWFIINNVGLFVHIYIHVADY